MIADWPEYEKHCPNFVGMQDGLRTLGIEYKVFSCRPEPDIEGMLEYKPDLVIYGLLDMVKHPKWRYRIREGLPNAKIVFWYGDYRDESTGQVHDDMSEIDMMFVSNNAQERFYKRRWNVPAVHFLPLGATVRNVKYDSKFDFDFVFIGAQITGSAFLNRAIEIGRYKKEGLKIIDADAQRLPELRTKILATMPTIYRSSKVCLDISHFTDVDGYTSNRFWNIGAAGGVALTKRFPGCEEFYPPDSRVYFDTFDESIEEMHNLIADLARRDRISARAQDVAKSHTYDKRFLEMFKKIYG